MTEQSEPAIADTRLAELQHWVEGLDNLSGPALEPASDDASFRRYFRVVDGDNQWIAMDAPPPREDCRPFVAVAGYLRDMGLNAPEIFASDIERGFLLMSDLGDCTYLDAYARGSDPTALIDDALGALAALQSRGSAWQSRLPPYDEVLLRREMELFRDWLCARHLGLAFSADDDRHWKEATNKLVISALSQPRVFVHRDYHSRNLMVVENFNPGILDFQDAVCGPIAYDLVSLLKDCYYRLPADEVEDKAAAFLQRGYAAQGRQWDATEAVLAFRMMGIQRHLKAAGIFARLLQRDGKDRYMADVPRTLGYIVEVAEGCPGMEELGRLIEDRCLPALESRR